MNETSCISGVLVHAKPGKTDRVKAQLQALPGVEIHHLTDDGRMIITVEAEAAAPVADLVARFHDLDGVINASMVYHYDDSIDVNERETSL